ncbi:MAG: PssD/Cps14F family polysaccharide biosynthesis glycosyltransferase [Methanosarcinales archaeon]
MKICLICSSGGHLTQLLQLEDLWKKYDSFYVTQKKKISKDLSKKYRTYFIKDPIRNPFSLILNFLQSFLIFFLENPDIIITTGGGIAISMCYLGKMFGKKVVFIESLSRVENPSLTGRFLYPIADLFLVQWKHLLKKYGSKAKYWGNVL